MSDNPVKKPRLDECAHPFKSLEGFQLIQVLKNSTETKTIFLEASRLKDETNSEEKAIVILEKDAFGADTVENVLVGDTGLDNILANDVYGTYKGYPDANINPIKVTIIYPATEKHIEKYSPKTMCIVSETSDVYETKVKPYLNESKFSLQWVYNILEHKTESERIIFEDHDPLNGFLLLPDMKWDAKDPAQLYALALCHRKDILSLRDLNQNHLPLLKNIRDKVMDTLKIKYSIPSRAIRAYIHYQPSYYHFHVHFNLVTSCIPGTQTERAHLLETVINNIEIMPDFYQKTTLFYCLQEDSDLFKMITENIV